MKNKLLLIRVSKSLAYGELDDIYTAKSPCVLTGLLDAYISQKGIDSEILDLEVEDFKTKKDLIMEIERRSPSLIGVIASGVNVSASTQSMSAVIDLCKNILCEFKEVTKFIYGGHPTALPQRTLLETHADFILIGEGYETLASILRHMESSGDKFSVEQLSVFKGVAYLENNELKLNSQDKLIDVNKLPRINWSKMNPSKYRAHNWHCFGENLNNRSPYGVIWTSMGCAYPCEFCCINNLYEKRIFRFRDMNDVVAEIDELVKEYKVKNIRIYDELFIMKHPRIEEFVSLLEQRNYDLNFWCYARPDSVEPKILKKLKGIGVNWIGYGFEAGENTSALKDINKHLKKEWQYSNDEVVKMTRDAGINMVGHAILGLWDDDEKSIENNISFLKKHKFEWNNIYPAFAYPGTPFYKRYISEKIIAEPKSWDEYALYGKNCKPLPTKHLSSAKVLELRDNLIKEYYSDPEILEDIKIKFGQETVEHIEKMFEVSLVRSIK